VELTSTSYALLGLLALRPWTTYELAQQVQRSLKDLWPVAERQLYEQPKTLVAHGLATARRERTGARPRTVYRITAKGRRALKRWLAETDGELVIRSELVLRAFFAEQADDPKAVLLAQLAELRERNRARRVAHVALYEASIAEGLPFPARRHLSALVASYYFALDDATAKWTRWAEAEIARWPDDLAAPPHADELLAEVYAHPSEQ
jgi:DNA-binding PadR family transcriptional regulator